MKPTSLATPPVRADVTVRDARTYDVRHQNVACPACAHGLHMVLVALDPTTGVITHTEGTLASTCACRDDQLAQVPRIAMRALASRLRTTVAEGAL